MDGGRQTLVISMASDCMLAWISVTRMSELTDFMMSLLFCFAPDTLTMAREGVQANGTRARASVATREAAEEGGGRGRLAGQTRTELIA